MPVFAGAVPRVFILLKTRGLLPSRAAWEVSTVSAQSRVDGSGGPRVCTHCSTPAEHQCTINAVWDEARTWGGHGAVLSQVMEDHFMHFDASVKQSCEQWKTCSPSSCLNTGI